MADIPDFQPDVLQRLTQNINKGLKTSEKSRPRIDRKKKKEGEQKSDKQSIGRKERLQAEAKLKDDRDKGTTNNNGAKEHAEHARNDSVEKSRKRLRNGELKGQTQKKRDEPIRGSENGQKKVQVTSKTRPGSKADRVQRTVLQPLAEWHAADLPALVSSAADQKSASRETIERLHTHAKTLLDEENVVFAETSRPASSSKQFYSEIMSSGTLSDKIGALTLSIQESPLHNMKAMESLLGLARKKSRAQAVDVLGSLKDLFGPGNLLPSDRKLMTFASHPELHAAVRSFNPDWTDDKPLPKPLTQAHLIFWAFEDWLKNVFFQTLQILETWSNDEVVFARSRAVDYIYSLLKDKPEQEANLLRLLVNKLGDKEKKVSSQTSFRILQLMTTHPAMKLTIVSAIESDLLFRPGQSLHAQYYAAITLNQTVLSGGEDALTRKLIDMYFMVFLKLLHKPDKVKEGAEIGKLPTKITFNSKGQPQGGGSSPGKKASEKRARNAKSTTTEEELREKLLSAVLTGVNRAIPFTSTTDEAFEKHIDTLFRVTHSSNFNTGVQALMLIQQIQGANQDTNDRFYRTLYESLLDPRLLHSSKQVLYLNLLFRALRSDLNVDRVKAFSKRILQVVSMHQPSFACGGIYLLRELESVYPSLQDLVARPEQNDEEEVESFHDIDEDAPKSDVKPLARKDGDQAQKPYKSTLYDPRKRDPIHANAFRSSLWDISPFLKHYHPSVSLFADRLVSRAPMPPKPDLGLNTLIHFLDRFVYKNPKSPSHQKGLKGVSIMQPLAGGDKSAILLSNTGDAGQSMPVNSDTFWKKDVRDVGADEVFFHKYFSAVGKKKEGRAEKKKRREEEKAVDESDVGSEDEEDEEEIWKALVDSKPEIEGDGFDDDDQGLSDLDEMARELEAMSADEDAPEGHEVDAGGSDDEMLDFEESDSDALFESDEELPNDLDEDMQPEEAKAADESEAHLSNGLKSKKSSKDRKKRLKSLPTFASAEDYEKILGGDDEEGVA